MTVYILQISEVTANIVWQEFWACAAIWQCGFVSAFLAWVGWRAYRSYTEMDEQGGKGGKYQ